MGNNIIIISLILAAIAFLIYFMYQRFWPKNDIDESEVDIHEDFKGEYFGVNIERFQDIEKFFMSKIEKQIEGSQYFINSEMEITLKNNCNIHILNEEDKLLLVAYFDPELFSRSHLHKFREFLEENEYFSNEDDRFDDEQVQIYQKLFGPSEKQELLDEMIDVFNYLNFEPYSPNINFSLLFGEIKEG